MCSSSFPNHCRPLPSSQLSEDSRQRDCGCNNQRDLGLQGVARNGNTVDMNLSSFMGRTADGTYRGEGAYAMFREIALTRLTSVRRMKQ